MRRVFSILAPAVILTVLAASLFVAGCGSADAGGYEKEVAEINRATSEKLAVSRHVLGEGSHGEEVEDEERVEAVVASLEEAVMVLKEALLELQEVKVPSGMEDSHHQLLAFYHANLAAYEGYMSSLEPGGGHAEGDGHGEEASEEPHGEEGEDDEEAAHEDEEAQQEEVPPESGGH